jgi:type IV pilus assembly protein PilE
MEHNTPVTSRGALQRLRRGFTLIEVMIVVAIVAILAAVALPSYRDYLRRGMLPDAFTALNDYRVKMEQYYQDNRAYGNTGATTCANNNAPTWSTFVPAGPNNFTFACALGGTTAAGAQTYTITATGKASTRVTGHVYTITHDNVQSTTTFKGAAVTKSCWLVRGSEC